MSVRIQMAKGGGGSDEDIVLHHRPSYMTSFWRRAGAVLLLTSLSVFASTQTFGWSYRVARSDQTIMDNTNHRGPPTSYEVVPGIFIQDDPDFNEDGYDSLKDSFGLIDKSPNRWTNLTR